MSRFKQPGSGRRRAAIGFVVLLATTFSSVRGFDTGHHSDLTFEVLQVEGFGRSATQVVRVENWLVDYYSGPMGEIPFAVPNLQTLRVDFSKIEPEMAKLHFDNLQDSEQIRNSWAWLTHNTRSAVREAARNKDPLQGLAIMGLTLHAVQDFYTHSNWVEALNGTTGNISTLKTMTWATDPDGAAKRAVWTGSYPPDRKPPPPLSRQPHGSYTAGMNHDSYVRPNWLPAYVAAYAGCRQWVHAIHGWANEVDPSGAYWKSLQSYEPQGPAREQLAYDVSASYKISEWLWKPGEHDGHWKGNGSGSAEFVPFVLGWAGSADSPYVGQVKQNRIQRKLNPNLASDGSRIPPVPKADEVPPLATVPLPKHALVVRTLHAKRLGRGLIPPVANMFAVIRTSGPGFDQEFIESMQFHNPDIRPSWTTVKFLPDATRPVDVDYRLRNEGGSVAGPERAYGLNGRAEQIRFRVNPQDGSCSGDLSGRPDGNREVVKTFHGSGNTFGAEAEVTISVKVVAIE